jgi:hypothetical protein
MQDRETKKREQQTQICFFEIRKIELNFRASHILGNWKDFIGMQGRKTKKRGSQSSNINLSSILN